jgi:uncharacterized membrane protein HdeD (DUF308 family)
MTEASRTILIAAVSVAAGMTWQGWRTAAIPLTSPDRLVAELRLAQVAALILMASASAYLGFASTHEAQPGVGLDIALAAGFGIVAAVTLVRDPRQALTLLALAFAAHAVVDVGHRPGLLPEGVAPRWYALGCAVFNVYIGAVTYLPILRR